MSTPSSSSSTDVNPTRVLTLKSSDGEAFRVKETVAVQSGALKQMVEDGCTEGDIPLHNVTAKVLSMVLDWCNNHGDGKEKEETELIEKWEKEFTNALALHLDDLHDVMLAANYLNVKALLDCCCQKVADMIKGKSPDEIRQTFNIKNDFTPEEEEEIRRESSWAFK